MDSSLLSFGAVILGVAVFVGFIYFVIQWEKKNRAKIEAQYDLFAATFAMTVVRQKKTFFGTPYPQIAGTVYDLAALVYTYQTGGKNKTTYTVLQVALPAVVPNFSIHKQGLFQKISKTFGGQDIVLGNGPLDEAFVFKCDDEAAIQRVIDGEIQQMLLALKDKMQSGIHMKKSVLTYSFVNHINSDIKREDAEKIFVMMLKLAKNIQST